MPLNAQVAALLSAMAGVEGPDIATATPDQMRAASDVPMSVGPPIAMQRVEELALGLDGRSLEARLYVPEGAASSPPLTLFYHGGGWVLGTLDTHDATARALARSSGSAVLSVAYRLAPEYPFPTPLDDCYAALEWAAPNGALLGVDASRLAVTG